MASQAPQVIETLVLLETLGHLQWMPPADRACPQVLPRQRFRAAPLRSPPCSHLLDSASRQGGCGV
eukprot:7368824-Pyramimonas_sp.AAC.1